MSTFTVTILGIITAILGAEAVMWKCFEARHHGIHFPREVDASFFRFFTPLRMRIIISLHAVFLVVAVFFYLWLLW